MENDALSFANEADEPPVAGPVLPPRRSSASEVPPEVWAQWAAQIEATPQRDRSRSYRHRWLLPTRGAALIATAGWVVGVVAQMLLLAALVPSFDLGETRHFLVPLDESVWFGATTIVAAAATAIGWLCWTVGAAFNVRRVSPLSTSPLLPLAVYVVGPIVALAGLQSDGANRVPLLFAGLTWLGVGHIMVVGSFRSAATRIGALSDEFAKLLWLPMAGVTYRLFVNVVLEFVPHEQRSTGLLFGLGAVGALFVCGMVLSTWRATTSFEQACHRLNTRALGSELPPAEVVGEAWRRANER